MEAMIQIVGMPMEAFWAEMDKRYGVAPPADTDVEYSTTEAMEKLNMKQHATFSRYLKRNNIICNRKQGKVKYYLHSQLFKTQTFK